ncbi:MAG TPA: PRC and DUF2382 domain-containing protein [Propionibacteriaceae bacterium]|nr:PRC and DUF2382 domain-containing protein [Propionibacteriaceae bacterium]
MPITESDLANLRGNVVTTSGDKIGSIGQIYLDDETGQPSFVTANTGLFGTSQSFVPLQSANVRDGDIVVDYDKDTVKNAPRIDDDGKLSPEEEDRLYEYYGLGGGVSTGTYDTGADYDRGADSGADRSVGDRVRDAVTSDSGADGGADRGADYDAGANRTVGHDTSGPTTDDAMTRSEERLNVGTQSREAGRARLRKYVTTENVQQTVPVQREEVRVEREPITDANIGNATSGPAISEEEHEVVLHEERPVVEKEAVPVERVRLDTETVTDEVTVSDEVRKEQIDTDVDADRNRTDR